jgi:mannosyltransferase OCH1-like enzyme
MQRRDLFDAFRGVYHAQADVLRYELLHQFGGIYLDADSTPVQSLDDLLREHSAWACAENDRGLLANSFLGMAPRAPLMAAVLDELGKLDAAAIAEGPREELSQQAWILTGPACLSEVVKETLAPIHVFPGHYFFPRAGEKPVYALHFWGTTFDLYQD